MTYETEKDFIAGSADDLLDQGQLPCVTSSWMPIETAPKDGTHILVCRGPYNQHWGFAQCPPAVVHWWSVPGEEGFYLSHGGSADEQPFQATHWSQVGDPPETATLTASVRATMKIDRLWAMPSPETFSIAPVRELIERHLDGGTWIDPFCRDSIFKTRCIMTNDINPKFAGTHNMDALDFLKSLPAASVDGVLFDPPFSPRQVKEAYQGFGPYDTTRRFYSERKREAARVLKLGGLAIVCGWNSLGLGACNGMKLEEVLLVNHGDQNDTIITVGRKVAAQLDFVKHPLGHGLSPVW